MINSLSLFYIQLSSFYFFGGNNKKFFQQNTSSYSYHILSPFILLFVNKSFFLRISRIYSKKFFSFFFAVGKCTYIYYDKADIVLMMIKLFKDFFFSRANTFEK